MNKAEIDELVKNHSYIVITPDGVGSKGDEAMICGILSILSGNRALLVTPNKKLWCDELLGKTHLFDECYVPLEEMPQIFSKPQWLIVLGADTLDGSCGYEPAHWRLEAMKAAVAHGGKAIVFCSIRSNMDQRLIDEWKGLPDGVTVFLRDSVSEENFLAQVDRKAGYCSDMSFFAEPLFTARVNAFCDRIRQTAKGKKIIGLQMSETMFRSFHTEITDKNRAEFAKRVAALAAEGILPENAVFLLLTHDTRSWAGHWSDYQYACTAEEYLTVEKGFTCVVQPAELTQRELVNVVSLLDIVICGRMHMSITAYLGGTVPLVAAGRGKNYVMVDKVRGMCIEWLGSNVNLVHSLEQIPELRDEILNSDSIKDNLLNRRKILEDRLMRERETIGAILGVHPVEISERDACEASLTKALFRSSILVGEAEKLDKENIQLLKELEIYKRECSKLESIIHDQRAFLEHRTEEVRFRDGEIEKLNGIIQDQKAFLDHRTKEVEFRDSEILRITEKAKRQEEELETIKHSRAWRLACLLSNKRIKREDG